MSFMITQTSLRFFILTGKNKEADVNISLMIILPLIAAHKVNLNLSRLI